MTTFIKFLITKGKHYIKKKQFKLGPNLNCLSEYSVFPLNKRNQRIQRYKVYLLFQTVLLYSFHLRIVLLYNLIKSYAQILKNNNTLKYCFDNFK